MKYNKKLAGKLKNYDSYIRKNCINYKYWKKIIKEDTEYITENWQKKLENDCIRVDKLVSMHFGCFGVGKYTYATLQEIACINLDTFYKVCKKLHKKLNVPAVDFYRECVIHHKYLFSKIAHDSIFSKVPD